jgi:microsomal dipeptidase-like Zn-dependent dipeptidase
MTTTGQNTESIARVPLGGDYWQADPGVPLWGFADLHAHLMAHLAFGGRAFWGLPFDPKHPGPEGIEYALPSCEPIHGGLVNINPELGHPAGGGWPEFIIWPRFTTLVHQQAYIDWLYRAYQGGLRLVSCLAVNNELLASKTNPGMPHDDRSSIQVQIAGMKRMAAFVDEQAGGKGKGWLQIVRSPEEARQAIAANKLAVVLGVEVDSLGNWRRPEDIELACQGDMDLARELIGLELDWLYALGVRQITPLHLTNNAFGGTAIYMRLLETINVFVTGDRWTVEDAWQSGVRYRLDDDSPEAVSSVERSAMVAGPRVRNMGRRTLLDNIPGVRDLVDTSVKTDVTGGHANIRGLNPFGIILLEEMMARGMVIDTDHMSQKGLDEALTMAEEKQYPLISTHSWFRDLLFSGQSEFDVRKHESYDTSDVHKVAHEAGKRADQVERIVRLGGMVSALLNQGDLAGLRRGLPELDDKVPEPCAGSSTSWAQAFLYAAHKSGGKGVAIGSDINGAAALPGPRFGMLAAYGARDDKRRNAARRGEIDRQTNGVAYSEKLHDYRWFHFPSGGPGGYDEDERDIWAAIAQYEAGFNPSVQHHPEDDAPEPNLLRFVEIAAVRHNQQEVDDYTTGFWLSDEEDLSLDDLEGWSIEQRAGYLGREGTVNFGRYDDKRTRELVVKIRALRTKWKQMHGNNKPLTRSKAGPRREFDINLDGMAHYGMLPDMLQDVRNSGLTAEDLVPLFRSANDYVVMWERCKQRAGEMAGERETK